LSKTRLISVLIFGLLFGLIFGLIFGLALTLIVALILGRVGLVISLIIALPGKKNRRNVLPRIGPFSNELTWELPSLITGWKILQDGLFGGVIIVLIGGLFGRLLGELAFGLIVGLLGGLIYLAAEQLPEVIRIRKSAERTYPNQGIYHEAKIAFGSFNTCA
jgi:predicted lipid-binding transport protein (Tim44 family)